MRKLFVSLMGVFLLGVFTVSSVSATTTESESLYQVTQDDMTQDANSEEVTFEDLPETVQTALKDEKYSSWTVNKISKVPQADGTAQYSVEFNADGETKEVKFDESGNVVE
ncbi:MAG: hypothetical protein KFF73_02265 [Cyclobacteriaceae bacterium]|nr:hypothetical protein [Cyclobacteriaceae bacterium]